VTAETALAAPNQAARRAFSQVPLVTQHFVMPAADSSRRNSLQVAARLQVPADDASERPGRW
jgi:hypothetical protein